MAEPSPQKTKILITGATGYIGGGILDALLDRTDASTFGVVAIVRDARKAEKLQAIGVHAVVGSHADSGVITPLAANADIVITAADVDDLVAARAILAGMKQRYESTGKVPLLIHTSGTGVLADDANGMRSTEVIYSDLDLPLLDSLPPSQPHRTVDLTVLKADEEGYVRAYIILPSNIYGRRTGRLVEAGISQPASKQIPRLIEIGLRRKTAVMVGEGKNLWPNVDINELIDLYLLVFGSAQSNSPPPHGNEGLFFGANGEHKLYDVYMGVGEALLKLGKSTSAEPTSLTVAEYLEYFGPRWGPIVGMYGSNARARADRGHKYGWTPKKGTQDMLDSILPEMEAILAQTDSV